MHNNLHILEIFKSQGIQLIFFVYKNIVFEKIVGEMSLLRVLNVLTIMH